MTGIIWFVQVVHYPLFAVVSDPDHLRYAPLHQKWTGWIVGPPMLLELATSTLLLWPAFRPRFIGGSGAASGFALLAIVWISTALLQVPLHERLMKGLDLDTVGRLIQTNIIRTAAWSLRSALMLFWLHKAL